MAEYIKREAVIDLITRRYENPEICTQEINSIPAADVVPVVRCKNCEHSTETAGYDGRGLFCAIWGREWQRVRPDDFCSYGERKDEPCTTQ